MDPFDSDAPERRRWSRRANVQPVKFEDEERRGLATEHVLVDAAVTLLLGGRVITHRVRSRRGAGGSLRVAGVLTFDQSTSRVVLSA
jgi:hypothetical protein